MLNRIAGRAVLISVSFALTSLATPASAARYYTVALNGVLVSELGYTETELNTAIDPNLSVGSRVSLTARFLARRANATAGIAGLYGLPTTGDEFWRVDAAGMTWRTSDDTLDGFPIGGEYEYTRPAIFFSGAKVTGLSGDLVQVDSTVRPILDLASFRIEPGLGLYGNVYNSQGFQGVWDYAGSTVTLSGIPEPATWATMIIGFGVVGTAMRRRRGTQVAA